MKDLTELQMSMIRKLAGGKQASPKRIREAAHRIVIGFSDDYDVEMVIEYIESIT